MRNLVVMLTVAGVLACAADASAFGLRKKKKCHTADVVVAAPVVQSQSPCGCETGIGTSFATPSYYGGNTYAPSYLSGSPYSGTGYHGGFGSGMYYHR